MSELEYQRAMLVREISDVSELIGAAARRSVPGDELDRLRVSLTHAIRDAATGNARKARRSRELLGEAREAWRRAALARHAIAPAGG